MFARGGARLPKLGVPFALDGRYPLSGSTLKQ